MIKLLLEVLTFGAVFFSILVITSKNPIIAVVFLISVFISTAGYLILKGIGFLGLSYIIIYIGAITVLFLFIIMMINIRLVDILEIGNEYTKNLPLAIILGLLFVFEIFSILPFTVNNVYILFTPINIFNFFNNLLFSSALAALKGGADTGYLNFDMYSNLVNFSFNNIDSLILNFSQIEVLGLNLYTNGSV